MKLRGKTALAGSLAVCGLAAPPSAALAAGLEEVIVTAEKREESLQATPISLQVFGTEQLESKGINNIADLQTNVPNLQISPHPNNAGSARIFLRGIGNSDDQLTQDGSVAVYLDGIYIARSQGLAMDIADIQRIEVLRGPQGTLYGRNATGGAINYVTAEPDLNRFGFRQQVSTGNENLLRAKTSVNVPLGETVAARLAYLRVEQDGFVDNRGSGEDRFGDVDRTAYRADLLWQPLQDLSVRYNFDRSAIEDTPAFFARVPMYPETADRPDAGSPLVRNLDANDVVAKGHGLTAVWDIDDSTTLKSLTAYREIDNAQNEDFLTGGLGPYPVLKNQSKAHQDQFSEEVQLLGDTFDQRLEYTLGTYYLREKGHNAGSTATLGAWAPSASTTFENKAYAVFGQAKLTPPWQDDKLHVTIGARWSKDEREATRATFATSGGTLAPSQPIGTGDKSYTNFSPSLVIAYDVDTDINAYAKVVRGYKTGGFNTRASSVQSFNEGFDPEKLTSYELGLKSQWLDQRLRLNTALFRADYDDIQVNIQTDPNNPRLTDVVNAGKATIEGLESELSALLLPGLAFNLNYAYLKARFDHVDGPGGSNIAGQFRFINAPDHSYAVDLSYQFPSLPFGKLTAEVGYSWQDNIYASAVVTGGKYVIGDYGLLGARLTLSEIPLSEGQLRFSLWGKNLRDEEYYNSLFTVGVPAASFGNPRTYGIDAIYEY